MTILFAGGEEEMFTPTSVPTFNSDPLVSDTAYTRGAIGIEFARKISASLSAASDEVWVHFDHYVTTSAAGFLDGNILWIHGPVTNLAYIDVNNGLPSFYYWNGSTYTLISTGPTLNKFLYSIDVRIKLHATEGAIAWYINGTLQGGVSGDTLFGVDTTIDSFILGPSAGGSSAAASYFSQVIASTSSTIGAKLKTLEPTADGANTAWVGTFADIDETLLNDTDFISSAVADQVETFTAGDVTVPSDYLIGGVCVGARGQRGASGPQNLQIAIRSNSTDYMSDSVAGLGAGYAPYFNVWHNDPDTSASWTESGVNAIEVGVKSIT